MEHQIRPRARALVGSTIMTFVSSLQAVRQAIFNRQRAGLPASRAVPAAWSGSMGMQDIEASSELHCKTLAGADCGERYDSD